VTRIELFLFGGLTEMSRDAVTPGEDFKIAAAGPLATLVVVLICLGVDLAIVGPHRLLHAVELDGSVPITPVLLSLSWLVPMNVLILLFNLIPAFPLDGGRIARAVVWAATGDRLRASRLAAQLGQGFAVLLAAGGIWLMFSYKSFSGLWLLAIAFMLWQSARSALLQTAVTARIEEVRVADVMDPQPISIPASTVVTRALDEFLLRYGAPWLPVVDPTGRFLGIAHRDRAQTAQDAGEGWLSIDSVLEREDAAVMHVDEDRPLSDVLSLESLGRLGAVMAVDHEGVLRGVITAEQIRRALQSVFASGLSG
jgi:Zn-dependent protease